MHQCVNCFHATVLFLPQVVICGPAIQQEKYNGIPDSSAFAVAVLVGLLFPGQNVAQWILRLLAQMEKEPHRMCHIGD